MIGGRVTVGYLIAAGTEVAQADTAQRDSGGSAIAKEGAAEVPASGMPHGRGSCASGMPHGRGSRVRGMPHASWVACPWDASPFGDRVSVGCLALRGSRDRGCLMIGVRVSVGCLTVGSRVRGMPHDRGSRVHGMPHGRGSRVRGMPHASWVACPWDALRFGDRVTVGCLMIGGRVSVGCLALRGSRDRGMPHGRVSGWGTPHLQPGLGTTAAQDNLAARCILEAARSARCLLKRGYRSRRCQEVLAGLLGLN
ncbi:hypothetical protein NDU88_000456 [Pleurodeles waltl]|uniref:Uncharacterized protein n=1 Tax=Pleurodeles waltl TaxID=8319 RepID=A0AAV7V8E8_PLEWA|nr:hypothetical protein NDU88_000456 [Pleurodeles waltl]